MGGLNSGPGPGITLLIAIVLILAQTALSAPLYEEDEGQENNSQSLAESHGCYYNFQHYNEGERILTNEPCLNCTCRNRMLMCYLRVCPFTKGIGQNCTVEKVPGQCCPIITCPEVPVQLLTSTTTEGVKASGGHHGIKSTEVGHLDTNGCNIDGIFYPNGAQVPGSPEKPCELCYCIRNKTACIMQECALHVDGCRPVYEEGQCFPVRYQCDDSPYEEEPMTTIRPAPTPGLIITTTSAEPLDCTYNSEIYEDGSRIQTEDPCEHCYCLKGKIACAVQECGAPLEKEGQNCTALPPVPGKCCPDSYQCDVTMTSMGLNYDNEGTTEAGIPSVEDAGHPTDGYHPDQGIKTTEKSSHPTNLLGHATETESPSEDVGEQKPTKTKPQELDKGTQNEFTESHLQGLHPVKPVSTNDNNQRITFPADNNEGTKRPGIIITSRPETIHINENESYNPTTDYHVIDMSNEKKQSYPESISHTLNVSTKRPEISKPVDHTEGTVFEHPDLIDIQPTHSHGPTPYNSTTDGVLSLKPQTSASDAKDPLLDKLHNIIQDVQAQVSDGKTTEMPEQVDYQTTMQSQTGHFTDKPEILSHLPQFGSQTTSSGLVEMESSANGTSDNSNDIINKLQGIIQGIYSHVTDSVISTRTPESSTMAGETESKIPGGNNEIIKPEGASELESLVPEKEDLKPHTESEYVVKPVYAETTREPEVKGKHPSKETTEKSQSEIYATDHPVSIGTIDEIQGSQYSDISERPQDFKFSTETPSELHGTEHPEETSATGLSEDSSNKHPVKPAGITPEGLIKLPLRPKPEGSYDEPAKYPEATNDAEEEVLSTEYPHMAVETTEQNLEEISTSGQFKPGQQYLEGISPTAQYPGQIRPLGQHPDKTKPAGFADAISGTEYPATITAKPESEAKYPTSIRPSGQYPEGYTSNQSNEIKPTEVYEYPGENKPTEQYPEDIKPFGQYPEKINPTDFEEYKPGQQYPEESRPTGQDPGGVNPSGQYLEEYKPTKQYPEGLKPSQHSTSLKPGQQYYEGSKPMEYYPEITKPHSPTDSSFQISYPEGVTSKPDEENRHPENIGLVSPGQYPEKTKPTDQFSSDLEKPTETKPSESNGIPFEHSEGVTNKPSTDNKYPQSSKYPEKIKQAEPESSSSESPFGIKLTESNAENSKPGNVSKYPEGPQPLDESLVSEKPNNSNLYSTQYPEKSGIIEHSSYGDQKHEKDTELTKTFETSTKHFESGKFKPDNQSKYSEGYRPEQKPSESYSDGSEDQTNYPESFIPTTKYPEDYKPNELLEGSKNTLDKNRPDSSTDSEYTPTENPNKIKVQSRPRPESDTKPSGIQYPEVKDKPDISNGTKITDPLVTFIKHPEKTRPEETPHETEHPEELTGKPDDGSKYSEHIKPIGEYPDGSKFSKTEKPESSKRPYSSEHPDAGGFTDKPEKESKYPEGFRPTDENLQRPKPGSEEKFYGSEYVETTDKPELSYESSTYKYSDKSPSTQKADSAGRPDDFMPTQQYPESSQTSTPQEQSKYSQKPEFENGPFNSESLNATDRPEEQFTEQPDYSSLTEKPQKNDDHHHSFEHPEKEIKKPDDENSHPEKQKVKDELFAGEYQTGITGKPDGTYESAEEDTAPGKPQIDNKFSQKPGTEVSDVTDQFQESYKPAISQRPVVLEEQSQNKSESGNEVYSTKYTEKPKVPSLLDSEDKLYDTEYPERITGKPVDSNKYSDENKEQGKRPQKPGSEHLHENLAEHPDERNPEQNNKSQGSVKYPEEIYVAQHPEKIKPPSEDQHLETDTKPGGLEKYPEKTKPLTEPVETDKLANETKYSEKSKLSSGAESNLNKPDIYDSPEQPDKPVGIYESLEGITKIPNYTAQYPQKPSDRPSSSANSEEMGKPQYTKESEYPERTKPDGERIITVRPQDLNKYPTKSKPESLDKLKDQIKYPTTSEEEPSSSSATDKPEDKEKYPEILKPETEHLEISGTDRPLGIKVPEGGVVKPEHPDQEPEKHIPTDTEKLGMTYPPDKENKNPQTSVDDTFGIEYPNSETVTSRPEDSSKSSDKPTVQKHSQGTEYPELPGKPEYESKYPESLTQTGQYTQSPYDSQSFPGSEHSDNKMTGRPEHHIIPEGNEVEHYPESTDKPQYFTKYPEGEKLHDSELSHGTGSPVDTSEYYTKYPDKFISIGIHPEADSNLQQSSKYPESSTQYSEDTTDRIDDYTKYPEEIRPTEHYFEATGNLQSSTKYPEDDHSFNTKHPVGLKPGGFYPGQPQVSEESPHLSTEYFNTGETDRPDLSTKYSEEDKDVTEYPTNLGITHERFPTEHNQGSEPTDSLHDTEHTHLSEISNEYIQKLKPGHDRPHPGSLTEHPIEGKPTGTYSHGSERPEEDELIENGVTAGIDVVTKLSDNMKPVGSETTAFGTEFSERVTDKPENVKESEDLKHPVETGTEYPETNTGGSIKENIHPEEIRPAAEHSIEYSPKPQLESESKPYGTEHPEINSTPEDQIGFTGYPHESSTTKYPHRPELVEIEISGLPDDLSEHQHGIMPGSDDSSENLGISGRPQGSMNYPQKKPPLENETSKNQYPDETDQLESSTTFPDGKKPESIETFGTVITDKPEKNKHPEDSKYSEVTTSDIKNSQRPKPTESYDTPNGTAYPETTDSENDIGMTETPEYLGQHFMTQRPKPIESGEKLHSTENSDDITGQPEGSSLYPGINTSPVKHPLIPKPGLEDAPYGEEYSHGIGFTEKPDDESKYSDKIGYLTSRPFLGRPKPTGSDQSFVTKYPEVAGQTSSSTYSEKLPSEFDGEHYSNLYSETTNKPVLEDELHGTEYPDESNEFSHGSLPTDKPYETKHPDASKPDDSGQLYTSVKYPEAVEEQTVAGHPSKTKETDTTEKSPALYSQDSKKPQETASTDVSGTENGFKPIHEYSKPSERPQVSNKYPLKPKPSTSDHDPHGAGHSETTEKPQDELFGIQYPKETENTVRPEYEKYPENNKVTGKPHGIHKYPLRPKPTGFEDEPFDTDYSETTEKFDETSTLQEEDAFSKKPEKYKPSKYPINSHYPESVFEKTPDSTEFPNIATARPNNENKHPEGLKPTEKPYDSISYPETHTEDGEKPYSTEYPEVPELTKHSERPEPQKSENEVNATELYGVTRKPVSSSGVPTDEFSTEFSASKPGIAYLPQGELFNQKVPSSEHLNEKSTPTVSSSTEIYFGSTDPAAGSPGEESSLSTLPHFESNQDKLPSIDLIHEHGSSPSGQDLINKYSEHTTVPSDLREPDQFSTKPIDETKPTEFEINAPISVDDYPGRPKPVVPGEDLHKVEDPNSSFVESSSFPSEISEIKKPEVHSGLEDVGTKKPDDAHQLSETGDTQYPIQFFSTASPSVHKYPDSTHNWTDDVEYPEGISTVKPGDYYTTSGKHKASTSKRPNDEHLESTDHVVNENTHLEEAFSTESGTEHITYENYPEGISPPAEGFTRRPAQDSVSFVESTTDASQGVHLPERVSTGSQKTTTPSDDDLINKLHNIISGIQSQVTDSKTTKQPYGNYEPTSPSRLPTEIPQDYLVTDKFGRPAEKPQEFVKLPHDQTPERLSTPSRFPIGGIFSSENEIYDQTTTYLEKSENQTNKPQFSYTSLSESTEHSVFVTSKSPEGILSTGTSDIFSGIYPQQEIAVGRPEELEKPHDVKHPEVPTKDAVTTYSDQFSPTSKYPIDELPVIGKTKPENSTSTELPDRSTQPGSKHPEEMTAQFSHKPSEFGSASFSQYPEDISTTASSVTLFEDSGKPDSETPTKTVVNMTTAYSYTQDRTTQIYQEIKGNQTPIENVNNLIAENNKTTSHNEDLLHQMVPQDVNQKHPISVPTSKPLHVVYPTYYPDGVMTHKPGSKPDEGFDKKVTVTPQSTIHEDATIKSIESNVTVPSTFGETHTIYDAHTEISKESSTTSPIVIIQEVHTEVHSERAPIKTDPEGYVQLTTTPMGDSKPEFNEGEPHDHRPEHSFEKFTKQPGFTSQTPQIIFGRPAIVQPTGDQSLPESQTINPEAGHLENDKFSILSTHAEYPARQPESSTKPGFVTVTPIGIVPVTKDTENIMHLYSSPKDKYPTSAFPIQYPESFTTASPVYPEKVKHTTEKGETADLTEIQTNFVTDQGLGTTHTPEILGTRFPSRKTTQKPTAGVPAFQEGTTSTPTQGIEGEYEVPHVLHPGVTKRPSFDILTERLPNQDVTPEVVGFTTTKDGITQRPQGVSFVPYKLINGNKIYYPEKESPERPITESSPFDGYDQIPYEIVNGTKFFYPNRVVTSQPEASQPTTTSATMGMYVPYKIVNGSKIYYTQDKTQKPEKFDGLDYVPFDIINGTKIFYPERVTTTPSPSLAMYVPFKIIDGTKVYYTKEAQEEPQNIPDEYDGFDYVPYNIVNGNKIFRPDHVLGPAPTTTEPLPAMYVPYKLLNGNRVYYPKDAQIKPESVPEEYDGFDLMFYEVVNGTKLFSSHLATTQTPEQVPAKTSAMFVPYKVINGTKVYFPKYAQNKPMHILEGYDGFDYLSYEDKNGTKVFHPERVTPKPEFTSTPAFYSSGMFVPYKIINNTKVFFPKDAQHKPRPLKPGYDGVQYLSYEVINGTKVFYPERVTTPIPMISSAMYVPYKLINGTKVYNPDKATYNPEKIPEGYEGFDYVPYEIVNGNKLLYPDRLKPTMGMYVPYKKINGSKVYYPKDSSEKRQPIPEGYDGADYVPYEIINGTKIFYPDRVTTSEPTPIMYVPYKMVNGTKVYYPKDAQHKPHPVTEGYDGFDSLPYEVINGTNVFHPEDITQRPMPSYPQGMFVPYKMINGTKVYYPQEAHKRPHPLSDEYTGLDYIPYEVVNGTKVFHPERLTPEAVPAMYVPYKLINGTKIFYPKHAQQNPQDILSEYDGFDYVPYEIINGSQVYYPNRVPNYQGMYVPYKIINGEKVFYPKYAQHNPSEVLDGYDGFDYLPYETVNGTNVIKPIESVTETPFEQAMYVPYKVINGTKVFYAEYAQYKPYLIPQGFDGFDYIPYEVVNGTKVFDPDLVATPDTPYKPAMYVPFKVIDGKKVYYPKHAQNKPHLVPEGYDGFDYIPYEVVNGTKIFDPEQAVAPGPDIKPGLYVPYKIMNGIKVYEPKYAHHKPSHLPQDYDGFDYLPYDTVNGNKVFYPEQSVPLKQAMYVPFKYVNGTKVFYPKYAQHVPIQTPEDYDGFEYIPYEIIKGDKVFHPEQAMATETPFRKALYVPYKIVNGTKIYYPKNSHYNPYLIPQGYDGFDYIPYEVVNGNKVFHPEQAIIPETSFKQAMYVPFRVVNGTKVYYPKHAQSKPQLILENYDGFDYLPYKVVNGTKVFDPQIPNRPTYLQGMYVPYKSVNDTKVFYPKDAHNKPNYVPEGYDGADYVPYEPLNNTKMFYPELISTAQPGKHGSAGVYVPFKVVNNKKVFYPKEATPFPPTVRYPYDGVAFVPHKMLGETSPSEIVYVDDNKTFKPHQPPLQPGQVPGEGSCYINNKTFANNTEIPPMSPCQASCICISSVVRCVRVKCPLPPENKRDCSPVYREGSCCPTYICGDSKYEYSTTTGYPETKVPEFAGSGLSGQNVDATTPFVGYGTQKRPSYESGDVPGKKPEAQTPSEEYHLHKPPKPKPEHESLEPYDSVEGQLTPDEDYDIEDEEPYGPGTCRYAGKVYVSAQQIPRDDPCDFCFCFRSDIICLQQSCPPPIPGCRDEPIQGFCCPRYECHVKMATMINMTSTTTTTTTTLPPHFFPHAFKGSATKTGCFVQGRAYRVGQAIPSASGPCMDCICGGNGRMKCEPKVCTPEPMIRKMISPSENVTSPSNER